MLFSCEGICHMVKQERPFSVMGASLLSLPASAGRGMAAAASPKAVERRNCLREGSVSSFITDELL